ncbi:hypothetical protein E2562_024865 [Oryza meyeriana var. granulata]|uniref:Uncharacterized protein n=1 Tax=Oryza meyeriana var. granulata TaxID=110450 RepID=A0A6G1CI17_9ORYZ|nr:hypothetical protein E2562_024865 [Oryza meyeriana var. granulata]
MRTIAAGLGDDDNGASEIDDGVGGSARTVAASPTGGDGGNTRLLLSAISTSGATAPHLSLHPLPLQLDLAQGPPDLVGWMEWEGDDDNTSGGSSREINNTGGGSSVVVSCSR